MNATKLLKLGPTLIMVAAMAYAAYSIGPPPPALLQAATTKPAAAGTKHKHRAVLAGFARENTPSRPDPSATPGSRPSSSRHERMRSDGSRVTLRGMEPYPGVFVSILSAVTGSSYRRRRSWVGQGLGYVAPSAVEQRDSQTSLLARTVSDRRIDSLTVNFCLHFRPVARHCLIMSCTIGKCYCPDWRWREAFRLC